MNTRSPEVQCRQDAGGRGDRGETTQQVQHTAPHHETDRPFIVLDGNDGLPGRRQTGRGLMNGAEYALIFDPEDKRQAGRHRRDEPPEDDGSERVRWSGLARRLWGKQQHAAGDDDDTQDHRAKGKCLACLACRDRHEDRRNRRNHHNEQQECENPDDRRVIHGSRRSPD